MDKNFKMILETDRALIMRSIFAVLLMCEHGHFSQNFASHNPLPNTIRVKMYVTQAYGRSMYSIISALITYVPREGRILRSRDRILKNI